MVKSQVFPRKRRGEAKVESYLRAMEQSLNEEGEPLIARYEVNGDQYLYMPGFIGEQIGLRQDKEEPIYPPPPQWMKDGLWADNLRKESVTNTEPIRKKVGVREGNKKRTRTRREVKLDGKPSSSQETTEENPVKKTMRLLEETRGYKSTMYPREAKAAKAMTDGGYTPEQIIECWKDVKSRAYYKDKELPLDGVQREVGNWAKGGSHGASGGHNRAPERLPTTEELERSVGGPLD